MSNEIAWLLELEVQKGRGDALRDLMAEMVASTKGEAGTTDYEWSLSKDGTACHIYERYADSDAVMTHLQNFGVKFAERFLAALRPTRFTVYGAPSADVREALTGFSPTYMASAAGFAR